ncbi:NACHT domain-containing protein [Nostoc sp. LEGE 06077]|uniref:NACHT domain-containing protein n=1 Tax=Nostoc sp. LEGE 06077 TaxID=915325 RepID=UPI00187F6D21|nr:NACHT domain-containing protein [Nostoc sp. LEGE 06077]MBE9206633.1 NACHT domain-containing protein [Nostoc sp. LEGE 06077]
MTGMEPWAISVVSGVAAPLIQSLLTGGSKIINKAGKILHEKEIKREIDAAARQYEKNYQERHGILKVLGMRERVTVESVYTAVQFLNDDTIQSFESIEKLEKFYRKANSRRFQSKDVPKQAGIKVANEKQYLMVLGSPGAGKSTFLRKMGLEALKGKRGGFQHNCIPVFIELKRFTYSNVDIEKFITEEFSICGFPSADKFTAKALEAGKLLILLDGLDEIPTKNLTEAINQIQNFVDKYDGNRFIASCRTAAHRNCFRRFSDVIMADFDDEQMQQFIANWFQSEVDKQAKTGDKCWELLQKRENSAAKELAHTPLLLTFLCLVYNRSQNFPEHRSVLYKKALRILLEEWAAEKRILRDEIYQGLHTELEEILLSEIAYVGFESDRLFFSQRDIVQQIKTFLASNLNAPQHLDGEAVLNAIAVQQGILVERAEDIFSFSHLTLQEYLTAQYIDDHRLVEKLVTTHLTDKRWKEVFLLVAGLMRGGADDLLLLMEKQAQNCINSAKLRDLLNWAEQITSGSPGDYKPVEKRAVAVVIANTIANAFNVVITEIIAIAIATNNTNVNANAIAIANFNTNTFAVAIAYIYANANTDSEVKDYTDAYIGVYAEACANTNINAYANAIEEVIDYTGELEELQVFNKVNFTLLITQLEVLKTQIPDEKEPEQIKIAFAQSLQQTLLTAFNLDPDMIDLTEKELETLDNYLYTNSLIIQCKQSAVRVSPQTWEAIESRMLLAQNIS